MRNCEIGITWEPYVFAIHSEWVDEAALELGPEKLLTRPVQGLRWREIGGSA